MPTSVKVTAKTRQVLLNLPRHQRQHVRGIEHAFYEIGQINVRTVRRLIKTGPRTGRTYVFRGRRHKASAPGEPPANRSGSLAKGTGYIVHGPHQMEFGMRRNYAKFLEEGTKKMRPRPHVVVTVNRTAGDALAALHRIPGKEIGAGRGGR